MISEKEYAIIRGSTAKKVLPLTFCERTNIMKRIIAILLCVGMLAFAAAGCGTNQKPTVATGDEAASLKASDYKNNFTGLCNYLSALGYINPLEDNKGVTYTVMKSEIIGASEGRRFTAQHTEKTTIEIYEFDLAALQSTPDEAATKVIDSVKKDGTFTNLIGETVKNVYLSKNGRFLMIYNDTTITDNSKDSDKNVENRAEVIEKFENFHAND